MKLTVRRLIGFLILLVIGLWFGLRVYQQGSIDAIVSSLNLLKFETTKDLDEAIDLDETVRDYHASWKMAMNDPTAKIRAQLLQDKDRFLLLLQRMGEVGDERDATLTPKILETTMDLSQLCRHYFTMTQAMLAEQMPLDRQKRETDDLFVKILERTRYLKDSYEQARRQTAHRGADVIKKLRTKDLVFLLSSLSGIVALSAIIWFMVGAPLTQLSHGMHLVKQQRWERPLTIKGFGEVAQLIRNFNSMAETLRRQQDQLEKEATTDELTGLLNFRAFQERMETEIERAKRTGKSLTLILADIDFFKNFNDTKGHLAGNNALQELARRLKDGSRPYDLVARFGGEEFAIVLPETDKAQGVKVAERVREDASNNKSKLTLSCGVSTYPQDAQDLKGLVSQADRRLYEAKRAGRNRVAA